MKSNKESRFKSVEELIKALEEYSGFCIEPSEVDTREKVLKKINEIQQFLLDEINDECHRYYQEASKLMAESEKKHSK
ncbi:MAG: hypothetical protein ACRC26_04765 [Bacteroidales bacterium]